MSQFQLVNKQLSNVTKKEDLKEDKWVFKTFEVGSVRAQSFFLLFYELHFRTSLFMLANPKDFTKDELGEVFCMEVCADQWSTWTTISWSWRVWPWPASSSPKRNAQLWNASSTTLARTRYQEKSCQHLSKSCVWLLFLPGVLDAPDPGSAHHQHRPPPSQLHALSGRSTSPQGEWVFCRIFWNLCNPFWFFQDT